MSRGPDVSTLLERRLRIAAEAAGVSIEIAASTSTPWASATFNGARHHLTLDLTLAGEEAGFAQWLATLPEADLPLRGHLVADVIVTRTTERAATIEALTVEER